MSFLDFILGRDPLASNAQLRKELTDLKAQVIVLQQAVLTQGKLILSLDRREVERNGVVQGDRSSESG